MLHLINQYQGRWWSIWLTLGIAAVLIWLAATTSPAWATPLQTPPNQGTIPPGTCPKTHKYEVENTAISYNGVWDTTAGEPGDSNGQISLSTDAGATATFTFTGVSLDLIVRTEPLGGYANVLIDGSQGPFLIEFHSAEKQYQVLRPVVGGLTYGIHTVEIEVASNPLFPARQRVLLDAYLVGDPSLGPADPYEPDDTALAATPVTFNTYMVGRKLDSSSDQDWVSFHVGAGEVFTITTSNLAPGTDTVLTLYDSDGLTYLAKSDDVNWPSDLSSQIVYTATHAGTYYAAVTPYPDTGGCSTSYDLSLIKEWMLYLPLILKNHPLSMPPPTPTKTPTSSPPPPPSSTPTATPACAPQFLDTIPVGSRPRGVALDTRSPSRSRAYVANYGSNSITVINTADQSVVTTIPGIPAANGIAFDPDHGLIWVTNYTNDTVTPIEVEPGDTFLVRSAMGVGDGPWGIVYVNGGVYVANRLGNSVTVINADTGAARTLSGAFNEPAHVAASPDTGKVYVTNFSDSSVAVVSAGGTSTKSINVFRSQPYGVAIDDERSRVYVSTVNSHSMVAIDSTDDTFLGYATFQRGWDPARPVPLRVLAFNPNFALKDGGHLWTTTASGDGSEKDQVLLIPKGWISTFNVPIPYDVGPNPREGIAIDLTTNRVYITSEGSNTLTVLGDNDNPCLAPFSFSGDEIISLPFKPAP